MKFLVLVTFLISTPCMAQYKCVVNGTTSYQERPCNQDSRPMALPGDTPVTELDRLRAKASFLRQKAVAAEFDERHAVEQVDIERRSALVNAENARKKQRCADLLRESKSAQDEANTYRYHQGLIDDAHRRKKEAEAAHFTECYAR